jgi:hypothetical protein
MTDSTLNQDTTSASTQAQPMQTIDTTSAPVNNQAPAFDYNSFFPEDIRKDPDFDKYSKNFPKDLQGIAKDYYHKNKHFGKAHDVVKAEIEAELNKPVDYKAEDYSYELPENYEIENEILDVAKNKARELGIKPEIAKQFMKELLIADSQIANKINENLQAEEKIKYENEKAIMEGLKKEWGFEYDNNLKLANATLEKLTSIEEQNKIVALPKDIQAIISKVFHKIGSKMSEGSIGNPAIGQPMSQADFDAKRKEIWSSTKPDSTKYAEEKELFDKFYN